MTIATSLVSRRLGNRGPMQNDKVGMPDQAQPLSLSTLAEPSHVEARR